MCTEEVVLYRGRDYIPDDPQLCHDLVHAHHSTAVAGHPGRPEEVISDHGPAFRSNFSHELAALLGVKLTPSTSYHPQTDGQTERVNQEIEAYLRVFVSHQQDNWADWLPLAEFAYNNKV